MKPRNVQPDGKLQHDVLDEINKVRRDLCLPPRKTLPTGIPGHPSFCPLANAFPPRLKISVGLGSYITINRDNNRLPFYKGTITTTFQEEFNKKLHPNLIH